MKNVKIKCPDCGKDLRWCPEVMTSFELKGIKSKHKDGRPVFVCVNHKCKNWKDNVCDSVDMTLGNKTNFED